MNDIRQMFYNQLLETIDMATSGHIASQATCGSIEQLLRQERQRFLYENPGFHPDGDVKVVSVGSRMDVVCAVITTGELQARLTREAQFQKMQEHLRAERAQHERRRLNMERKLRKLSRKYAASLPPGMCSVWDELRSYQQYAILKDIDYAVRHSK